MGYGGRRRLVLYLDREASDALDALVAEVDRNPEQVAWALLRRALLPDAGP
jgi:hypothetical protein